MFTGNNQPNKKAATQKNYFSSFNSEIIFSGFEDKTTNCINILK